MVNRTNKSIVLRTLEEAGKHLLALETNLNIAQHRHRFIKLTKEAMRYMDEDDPVRLPLNNALENFAIVVKVGRRIGKSQYEATHRWLSEAMAELDERDTRRFGEKLIQAPVDPNATIKFLTAKEAIEGLKSDD